MTRLEVARRAMLETKDRGLAEAIEHLMVLAAGWSRVMKDGGCTCGGMGVCPTCSLMTESLDALQTDAAVSCGVGVD